MKYRVYWTDERRGMTEVEATSPDDAEARFQQLLEMGAMDRDNTEDSFGIEYVEDDNGNVIIPTLHS